MNRLLLRIFIRRAENPIRAEARRRSNYSTQSRSVFVSLAFLLASGTFAATAGTAQAQMTPNCVGYLTADVAFEKVRKPYHQMTASAKKARDKKTRALLQNRDNALRQAHRSYREDSRKAAAGALKAELEAAKKENFRAYRQTVDAASTNRKEVEARAKSTYRETVKPYEDRAKQTWRAYTRLRREARGSSSTSNTRKAARDARVAYRAANRARDKARRTAAAERRQEFDFAKSLYDDALRDARAVRNKADATAQETHRNKLAERTKPFRKALHDAMQAAEKTFRDSKAAAEKSYRESIKSERESFEKARNARDEAYIAAYANPVPGVRRRTGGYDRDILMKVARFEREKHCPKL